MKRVSESARALGYAGLLPQVATLLAVFKGGEWAWTALALAYAYAALIFSFLGGVWWGIGIARPESPRWIFLAGVMPSLIALALWWPWMAGWSWPGPELIVLGICLAASPLVDMAIGLKPEGWLALRLNLSVLLGGLSVVIGLMAERASGL